MKDRNIEKLLKEVLEMAKVSVKLGDVSISEDQRRVLNHRFDSLYKGDSYLEVVEDEY
jgi:hypothetical protein